MESIKIQNVSFQLNPDNGKDLIRWGILKTQEGGIKVIAFKIDILEATFANKNNRDFIKESNNVIEKECAENGSKNIAYGWVDGVGFEKVEPSKQKWFKFSE